MQVECHRGIMANEYIAVGSNSYEKVKTFKYLGPLKIDQNSVHEEIKSRFKAGNSCYYSVQILMCSLPVSKKLKIKYIKQFCQLCYMVVKHRLLD
jgi:hypothetical protein